MIGNQTAKANAQKRRHFLVASRKKVMVLLQPVRADNS